MNEPTHPSTRAGARIGRSWLLAVALAAIAATTLWTVAPASVRADDFLVVSGADDLDDPGEGTLRWAILEAIGEGPGSARTITFASDLNVVLAGELPAIPSAITLAPAITIDGGGHNVTIDGDGNDRVFRVSSNGNLTLANLTVTGGQVTGDGGGINVAASGRLTLVDAVVAGNSASGLGGGIYIASNAQVAITGSVVEDNSAGTGGGIVTVGLAVVTIVDSDVRENTAAGVGGGISQAGGTLRLVDVGIIGNEANSLGGGIRVTSGTLEVVNSTFDGNHSIVGGGGGGLAIGTSGSSRTVTIVDSTITSNGASTAGGGILLRDDPTDLTLRNVSLHGNTAAGADVGVHVHVEAGAAGAVDLEWNHWNANGVIEADDIVGVPAPADVCGTAACLGALELTLTGDGAVAFAHDVAADPAFATAMAAIASVDVDFDFEDFVQVFAGGAPECATADSPCDWDLPLGLALTLEASPAGTFEEWQGDVTGSDPTLDVSIGADGVTVQVTAAFEVVVEDVVLTTASLPDGTVGVAYSTNLEATGGAGDHTWSLEDGDLPDGLTLDGGGEILGTPQAHGLFEFTVRVTDIDGDWDERVLEIEVLEAVAPPADPGDTPGAEQTPVPGEMVETTGGVSVPVVNRESVNLAPGSAATLGTTAPDGSSISVTLPSAALPVDLPADTSLEVAAVADLSAVEPALPVPPGSAFVAPFVVRLVTPDGSPVPAQFEAPVTLEFTVPAASVPAGATSDTLVVTFWNGSNWVEVEATVTQNADGTYTIEASVDHFTIFSVQHQPNRGTFAPAPAAQGISLTTWGGGGYTLLASALPDGGSVWVTTDGKFTGYIVGAPAFVNAAFLALFPTGVDAGTPLVVAPASD